MAQYQFVVLVSQSAGVKSGLHCCGEHGTGIERAKLKKNVNTCTVIAAAEAQNSVMRPVSSIRSLRLGDQPRPNQNSRGGEADSTEDNTIAVPDITRFNSSLATASYVR